MSNAEFLSRPFPLLAKLAAMLRNIAPVRKAFVRFGNLLRSSKKSDEPLVSEFVGEIPTVAEEIPETIDETPAVTDETAEIVETPGVARDPLEVADEVAEATDAAPQVACEVPEVAYEVSEANNEAPDIIGEAAAVSETVEPPVTAPAVAAEAPVAPECSLSARERLIRRRWAETGIKMWNGGHTALNIQGSADLLPAKPGETRREYDRLEFRLIAGQIACEGVVLDPPTRRK